MTLQGIVILSVATGLLISIGLSIYAGRRNPNE